MLNLDTLFTVSDKAEVVVALATKAKDYASKLRCLLEYHFEKGDIGAISSLKGIKLDIEGDVNSVLQAVAANTVDGEKRLAMFSSYDEWFAKQGIREFSSGIKNNYGVKYYVHID